MAEKYGKLVRDKIPQIIRREGKYPRTHTATGEEYRERLKEKLLEEVEEYRHSGNIGELADLREVIDALCDVHKVSKKEPERFQRQKAKEKGKFLDRTILESVE